MADNTSNKNTRYLPKPRTREKRCKARIPLHRRKLRFVFEQDCMLIVVLYYGVERQKGIVNTAKLDFGPRDPDPGDCIFGRVNDGVKITPPTIQSEPLAKDGGGRMVAT